MRALMLEAPAALLEERRRLGLDLMDEMWDGVLHMVPPPSSWHQGFGGELFLVLGPIAKRLGLEPRYEIGLYEPGATDNWRVPDLALVKPQHLSERGIEGVAELVVEILSPGDESRDKIPFYASMGVAELWLVDPFTRAHEIYRLAGGELELVAPVGGITVAPALGVRLSIASGPRLRLVFSDATHEI